MRPSTAEGWYVLPIIVVSFRKFRGKKPVALRPVNAVSLLSFRPSAKRCPGMTNSDVLRAHPITCPKRADALDHPAGRRGLREPGDGAGHRLAPAADSRRFRNDGGRSLDRGRGLCGQPR